MSTEKKTAAIPAPISAPDVAPVPAVRPAAAGWEARAREVQREKRRDLASLPGCYVVVRKFAIQDQEALNAMRADLAIDPASGVPTHLAPGDLLAFYRFVLRAGVFEGNFGRPDGSYESFADEEFLDRLLGWGEISTEIVNLVMDYNVPLATGNDAPLKT